MEWISVEDALPEDSICYVIVACEETVIDFCLYSKDRKILRHRYGAGGYSRKHQGKLSGYFSLAYEYGYTITHWMPIPAHPAA